MPYITKEDREYYIKTLAESKKAGISTAGDLNYLITKLCLQYLDECGECYKTHNEIMGVLESAKQEWYRRQVSPYEDTKIAVNGDM